MKQERRPYLLPHERYLMKKPFFQPSKSVARQRPRYGPDGDMINAASAVDGILGAVLGGIGLLVLIVGVIVRHRTQIVGQVGVSLGCLGIALLLLCLVRTGQAFIVWRRHRRNLNSEHVPS
jgi:hypothetical protein